MFFLHFQKTSGLNIPVKYPFGVCSEPCKKNQAVILSDLCRNWIYFKCSYTTKSQFHKLGSSIQDYFCPNCYINIFPFQNEHDLAFNNLALRSPVNNDKNKKMTNFEIYDKLIEKNVLHKMNITDIDNSQYCTTDNLNSMDKKCKFSLLCIIIRNINANFEKLEELLINFQLSPDIIALSETKLKLNQHYRESLPGYNFFHKGTTTNYSGVGLFDKDHLFFSTNKEFELNCTNCEELWVEMLIDENKKCAIGII